MTDSDLDKTSLKRYTDAHAVVPYESWPEQCSHESRPDSTDSLFMLLDETGPSQENTSKVDDENDCPTTETSFVPAYSSWYKAPQVPSVDSGNSSFDILDIAIAEENSPQFTHEQAALLNQVPFSAFDLHYKLLENHWKTVDQPNQDHSSMLVAATMLANRLAANTTHSQPFDSTGLGFPLSLMNKTHEPELTEAQQQRPFIGVHDFNLEEEINTKDLALRISAELKRYNIPQAVFAQTILCRSQGTLSDLLRNPKPWSKLKSGRETFRRMHKWLQEPEAQRMACLKLAASHHAKMSKVGRKREMTSASGAHDQNFIPNFLDSWLHSSEHSFFNQPVAAGETPQKKTRLVFTEIQRRTLHAIFSETNRPTKEMQIMIAQQLDLEVNTVANFFMNARRRSSEKWKEDELKHHHIDECSSSFESFGSPGFTELDQQRDKLDEDTYAEIFHAIGDGPVEETGSEQEEEKKKLSNFGQSLIAAAMLASERTWNQPNDSETSCCDDSGIGFSTKTTSEANAIFPGFIDETDANKWYEEKSVKPAQTLDMPTKPEETSFYSAT